eukprot:7348179-Ditylum_brightwellii.AAC.1
MQVFCELAEQRHLHTVYLGHRYTLCVYPLYTPTSPYYEAIRIGCADVPLNCKASTWRAQTQTTVIPQGGQPCGHTTLHAPLCSRL